jgi:ribose 1,5-bisphosphate isomerase
MDEQSVATVFLRTRGAVLLNRLSDAAAGAGLWDGVSGRAGDDPQAAARAAIREETGIALDRVTLVRAGDPLEVTDDRGIRRHVHPFLFDCQTRELDQAASGRAAWLSPTATLHRETVPGLWDAYDRVRPTVETVASDTDHGSTYLSARALELLRDEAAVAAREDDDPDRVLTAAREVLAARPAMTALPNRVHRAMTGAATDTADPTPGAVEHAASAELERALRVDGEAAATAAGVLGERVATLSRSGTVRQAVQRADPGRLLVAESAPGREGVGVAETLAATLAADVVLTSDAAFAGALATHDIDTLLVGADAVLADGRVLNKVGTRGAALAATREGIDVLVAAASDKISPDADPTLEPRESGEVYDGTAPIAVENPTFDVTPADVVDAVVTERGALDREEIRALAAQHRSLREWQSGRGDT